MKKWQIVIILIMSITLLTGCYPFNKQVIESDVVEKVETVTRSGDSSSNLKLIKLSNNEWYKVEDELLLGHFRSRDLYGILEEDQTYVFTTYGWRIGFFSSYPNVVEIKEINIE